MVSAREIGALALAGLIALVAWLAGGLSPQEAGGTGFGGFDSPTPRGRESEAPLGTPAALPGYDGLYAFAAMQDDDSGPVAWDPCRTISYVVNPRAMPPGAEGVVEEAVAEMSAVTGLRFSFEGVTDEVPSDERAPFQEDRYGDRWAPVLIAWSDVAETPDLADSVAGTGGGIWVPADSDRDTLVYVSGQVVIDGGQVAELLTGLRGRVQARSIVLHELGHLVGLDHVQSETELMNAKSDGSLVQFGAGDRYGLYELGSGRCVDRL